MSTPMTPERAERLEEIGFQWSTKDPRHVPWEKRYSELVDFAVSGAFALHFVAVVGSF